jgi:hypothetical protein
MPPAGNDPVRGLFPCSGGGAPVELPAPARDGIIYVVTKTAAALIGVADCTITRWRDLGYLTPVPGSPPRKPLYRWPDVVEAEYQARQAAIAASGTDRQVRRARAA